MKAETNQLGAARVADGSKAAPAGWLDRAWAAPAVRGRAALAEERGSGSIAGVAVLLAVCAVLLALAPIGGAVATRQRLVGAADAAALATADTSSGRHPGVPCEIASAVASANGAELAACSVDPTGIATVTVATTANGWPLTVVARAGPPP